MEYWSIGVMEEKRRQRICQRTEDRGRRTDTDIRLLSSVFCLLINRSSENPILQYPSTPLLQIILSLLLAASPAAAKKIKYIGPGHVDVQDSVSLRDLAQDVFTVPEYYLYDLNWGWINAGQATLELTTTEKPNLWKVQSLAWCNKFFQTFYPVYDTIFSIMDAKGIYPVHFEKNLHEGSYEAHIKSWFDQEIHKAWLQDTVCDIEPFTHDIFTAFYYIRTQELKPGNKFTIDAVSGKKKYKLVVICHKRETVEVPAGKFRTVVVEPKLTGVHLFKAKGKLTIWMTDDKRHVPVKMKSKIAVGSITGVLVRAKGSVTIEPPPKK
jgi:hypothetical protein